MMSTYQVLAPLVAGLALVVVRLVVLLVERFRVEPK